MRSKLRLRTRILAVLAVCSCLLYAWHIHKLMSQNMPITVFAENLYDAVWERDAKQVLSSSHNHERRLLGLDARKVEALIEWYHECVKDSNPVVDEEKVSTYKRGYYGFAQVKLEASGKPDNELSFAISRTPDGPQTAVVFPLVSSGIFAKYGRLYPEEPLAIRRWLILRDGLEREIPTLEGMGILGIVKENSDAVMTPWASLLAFSEKAVEMQRKQMSSEKKKVFGQ